MGHGWASSVDHHVATAICWSSLYSSDPLISFLLIRPTASIGKLNPLCVPLLSLFPSTNPPSLCLCSSSPPSDHCSDQQTSIVSRGSQTQTRTHTKLNYKDSMGWGSEREIGQSACTPPLLTPPLSWLDGKVGQARGQTHTHTYIIMHTYNHTHTHKMLQKGNMCV